MGRIRFRIPGQNLRYPYLMCKKSVATIVRYGQNVKQVLMLFHSLGQHMRFWYFSHYRARNAQVSLRQCTGSSELLLLANTRFYVDEDSDQISDL